jgi:formylglycine-generating enzyme required for sulfatase activity
MTRFCPWAAIAFALVLGVGLFTIPAPCDAANVVSRSAAQDTAMVLVPAGEFVMGRDVQGDWSPAHRVRISGFYLDRCEVTNAQYEAFCRATGRKLPMFWGTDGFRCGSKYPRHPVVGVSWDDAREYAEWRGKRLPTEAEWEYAARGGLAGMRYPNGNTLDSSQVNFARSLDKSTVPVGSYAPNGYGLCDMIGNVVEWVADRYDADYYSRSPEQDPPGPDKGRFRVIRGGGWHSGPGCTAVDYRNALPRNWLDFNVGFRCARSAAADTSSKKPE